MSTFAEQTKMPVDLTCEGCDAVFQGTAMEAFAAGWDCAPWFWSHVTCPNCPITVTLWWQLQEGKQA